MSNSRWNLMWELFHRANELPVEKRSTFLEHECAGDSALRDEVEELLAEADAEQTIRDPALDRTTELVPGTSVGNYRIVRPLAEGGMGVIYEAEQVEPVRRRVALKLIRPGFDSREVLARFEAERQALAILDHPGIAQVYDAGVTDRMRPYFAMELVKGLAIHEFCDRKRLATSARLELFVQVCDAVQHAHRRGIIHRDLKPSNILVSESSGRALAKIIDFGIARATQQSLTEKTLFTQFGQVVGTPEYMSPEQAGLTGEDVDTRTDVYALGVVLYELLVGARPFDSESLREAGYDEMRRIIREEDPPLPSRRLSTLGDRATDVADCRGTDISSLQRRLESDLDWIVMRCLEKDRERRYESPADIAADVKRSREHRPVEARPPSAMYRLRKFVRRHRIGVAAGVLITLALVSGISIGAVGYVRAVQAEKEASRSAKVANEVTTFLADTFAVARPSEREADSISARDLLDRGAARVREGEIGDTEVRMRLLLVLGDTYMRIGAYESAGPLLEEAASIAEQGLGASGKWTSSALNALGGLAFEQGRYEDALSLFDRAEHAFSDVERDPGLVAAVVSNKADVLQRLGRRNEALELQRRALAIHEQTYGKNSEEAAIALLGAGDIQMELEQFEESRDSLQRALEIFDAKHGPEHPYRLYLINSLGILEWQLKNFERARPYFEESLASVTRTHGQEHPYTASMMNNLGRLLMELEDFDESEKTTRRALALREAALGPDHFDVSTSLLNLAQIFRRTDRAEQAVPLYVRAMKIKEATLGAENPELIQTLKSWADLMDELERPDRAAALRERAQQIEASNGRDH